MSTLKELVDSLDDGHVVEAFREQYPRLDDDQINAHIEVLQLLRADAGRCGA